MSAGAYSQLKVIHHPEKLAQLRRGEQPVPAQVQLVISDLCNHSCAFCSYRLEGYSSNQLFGIIDRSGRINNNPNRMIPVGKALEIIDDCAAMGVKAIQITGGGEPTVHPDHESIFKAVLDKGIDLAVVSNGAKFRPRTADLLSRAKWVRFSLDAGRPETYAAIRRISSDAMARTLDNIRAVVAAKGCARIGVGFVVTAENWREVVDAAIIAKGLGVDNFRMSAFFQPDGAAYFQPFHAAASALCQYAESLAGDGFAVVNMFGRRLEDLEGASPDYERCGYQHFNTYIGADLNVYRCCTLAYNERGKVGSIADQRFAELWESEAKRLNMAEFDARGCERCPYNGQNRVIAYAVDPEPADVHFV